MPEPEVYDRPSQCSECGAFPEPTWVPDTHGKVLAYYCEACDRYWEDDGS